MTSGTSSTSSSQLRLSGLASGIDTESIIKQMLAGDQAKIDSLTKEKELVAAKKSTWQDISDQLKSLGDTIKTLRADATGTNTLWDNKKITNANEDAATVVASSSAVKANYSIEINHLAKATVIYGNQNASYTAPADGTFEINGETVSYLEDDTLVDIANRINNVTFDAGKGVTATVIDSRLVLQTENGYATGTTSRAITSSTPGILTTLGVFSAADTYTNAAAQTSRDSEIVVNGITVTDSSNTLSDAINGMTITLHQETTSAFNVNVATDTTGIKQAINDFIDSYNESRSLLKRVRELKMSEDEKYGPFFSDSLVNSLLQDMRSLVSGSVVLGDYDTWDGQSPTISGNPSAGDTTISVDLTTAKAVTAGTIIQIEGDSTFYTVTDDATSADPVSLKISPPLEQAFTAGAIVNLSFSLETFGVGVRSDSVSALEGVMGVLDEGKLDAAIESNVDVLRSLFKRVDPNDDAPTRYTGVAQRMYDWMDAQTKISFYTSTTRSIDDTKMDALDSQTESLQKQIETLQKRMDSREQSLVAQFSNMENAISKTNAASAQLTNLASGG